MSGLYCSHLTFVHHRHSRHSRGVHPLKMCAGTYNWGQASLWFKNRIADFVGTSSPHSRGKGIENNAFRPRLRFTTLDWLVLFSTLTPCFVMILFYKVIVIRGAGLSGRWAEINISRGANISVRTSVAGSRHVCSTQREEAWGTTCSAMQARTPHGGA